MILVNILTTNDYFSFRFFSNQTGTVLVKASLVFQSNKTNADEIKGLFMNATAADKEINGLKVNPNFTQGKH